MNFIKLRQIKRKKSSIKAYLFGDTKDETRTRAFVNLLLLHEIAVYTNDQLVSADGKNFDAGKSYIVPIEQANYIMLKSIFEKAIPYVDSTFYDASTWSLIHAYGLPYAELKSGFNKGNKISVLPERKSPAIEKATETYVFELNDYNAHRAIYALQSGGAIVQTAFKPFTIGVGGKQKKVLVMAAYLSQCKDSLFLQIHCINW
ncbi:MAG: hypothetical protein FYV88_3710 [Bacteroidetes bacterium]|nr:hypothetical protein [Bacteroidota bacterium]